MKASDHDHGFTVRSNDSSTPAGEIKRYHRWEQRIMEDGMASLVEVDATDEVRTHIDTSSNQAKMILDGVGLMGMHRPDSEAHAPRPTNSSARLAPRLGDG